MIYYHVRLRPNFYYWKNDMLVPHLVTAQKGPLNELEQILLNNIVRIEGWFRSQWHEVSPLFYGSVDLRNAGFKLAPVDTNLFPAGFNNLNADFLPLCIQAVQATIEKICPTATQILLVPENHTRNIFYFEHLASLQEILSKAGFLVRIGMLSSELKAAKEINLPSGKTLKIEPLTRKENRLYVEDFSPCLILLNNDLSSGVPEALQNLEQKIIPSLELGWATRSKFNHFVQYDKVCHAFANHIGIDPWLISSLSRHCGEINFMTGEGEACLVKHASALLEDIQKKYKEYDVKYPPFLIVKADTGTYGMAVMTIKNPEEITQLNHKERLNMSTIKGGKNVSSVIIQEGIYTFETWGEKQAVAEPVVYIIGKHVVGGFYRVHASKGVDENLNSPGMNFEPLAFADVCNNPCYPQDACTNRFYAYGVIARLSLLAAACEVKATSQ